MITKGQRIFVSNRLPFSVNTKTQKMTRGSGGLVSALMGVSLDEPFTWMGFETDPQAAQILRDRSSEIKPNLQCCPVLLSKEDYDRYYDGVSNDVLWPLFHYEGQLVAFDRDNWRAYQAANALMAEEVLKVAKKGDTVWIHDFHFLLLPAMIKKANPQIKIGFFLHIPFPSLETLRQLPVREEIVNALLYCDLLGFHEHSYLRHFLVCVKGLLGLESTMFKVQLNDHTLNLGVYPISIDSEWMKAKAASPEVENICASYMKANPSYQILGVDRLDYTKGLELKLRGFQTALRKYPQLIGKISLLQVAVPSRQKVPHYMKIKKDLDQLVGAINGEFSRPNYVPVQYIFNSIPEETLLALYRRADAALITSKRDGMNLVAMEYVASQNAEKPGVLILSEFAGAASLLGDAILINPWDRDIIADSIYEAYNMPAEEKQRRMANLQGTLCRYSATQWAQNFLTDLDKMSEKKGPTHGITISRDPENWPLSLYGRLNKNKFRLILDFDGTLVALKNRPEDVFLMDDMKELLRSLQSNCEIFILSGRPKEFLDEQFKDLPFHLVAEHGAFYRYHNQPWRSRISSDVGMWYGEVETVMKAYTERVPYSFIEYKEAAVVWHYRQSPNDFADYQAKRLDEELKVGLANEGVSIIMGSKIVEAKAIECNKGSFLRWLMQTDGRNNGYYLCIGDDRTDEDMFRAVGAEGCTIKVGPGHTVAQYRLSQQEDVLPFLKEMKSIVNHYETEMRRMNHASNV